MSKANEVEVVPRKVVPDQAADGASERRKQYNDVEIEGFDTLISNERKMLPSIVEAFFIRDRRWLFGTGFSWWKAVHIFRADF